MKFVSVILCRVVSELGVISLIIFELQGTQIPGSGLLEFDSKPPDRYKLLHMFVVTCAKFCSDHSVSIWMKKRKVHRIWISIGETVSETVPRSV